MKAALVLIVALLVVVLGYWTYRQASMTRETETVACTMEAKLCPDGSYVGRVPPSCDFARCPNANGTSSRF